MTELHLNSFNTGYALLSNVVAEGNLGQKRQKTSMTELHLNPDFDAKYSHEKNHV